MSDVTFPDTVTSIGASAFSECVRLNRVTLSNSLTVIGDLTFYECGSLSSITIPSGVTSIGDEAFKGCNGLTRLYIPELVSSIGRGAFDDCINLEAIYCAGNAPASGSEESINVPASVYYFDGATGFSEQWGGMPTKRMGFKTPSKVVLIEKDLPYDLSTLEEASFQHSQNRYEFTFQPANVIDGGSYIVEKSDDLMRWDSNDVTYSCLLYTSDAADE